MARPPRRTISQRSEQVYDLHEFSVNADTREVFVSGATKDDGTELGIDHRVAAEFIRNLTWLDSLGRTPILVHFIVCGGDWNYGMAMYDAVRAVRAPVVSLSHAHARSMSSIIPQAACRRVIMPTADFLFHFGTLSFAEQDCQSVIAEAEKARQDNAHMVEIYSARCARAPFFRRNKYSRDRVRKWLVDAMNEKREVYLSATEAVDKGFMDRVFGTPGFRTLDELRRGL